MLNKMDVKYAKKWFISNYPNERLLSIYEYDNCFVFNSVPKGMEKDYGNIVRNQIGLDKETGEYFSYNPLKYATSGKEVSHVVEDITEIYAEIGEKTVNKLI